MFLVRELVTSTAARSPEKVALTDTTGSVTYGELERLMLRTAAKLMEIGVRPGDRVALFGPKSIQLVAAMFGISAAGGIFIPVNPVLKGAQVRHILLDSGASVLVGTRAFLQALGDVPVEFGEALQVIALDEQHPSGDPQLRLPAAVDNAPAAILYTSGSTGRPKGVVLSHRNIVCGAASVGSYLGIGTSDKLLAVLPLSFDYGLNQVTAAFHQGAEVVLLNYLLPRDVVTAVSRYGITGLAAVPPLWSQLVELDWPAGTALRYITNSGGAMPPALTARLQARLPRARIFLMYGLTEAFRSTFLDPDQIERRPTSIGTAVPNAEVLVLRDDGTECEPDEVGELVHCGPLVAQGYWNDEARTALRFRPFTRHAEVPVQEIAVWSGDLVRRDAEGYLYFVGRSDEQIKTSGYRLSPGELEEFLYETGMVREAVVFGVPDEAIGARVMAVVWLRDDAGLDAVAELCRTELPNYMVPNLLPADAALPRGPNGKIDRVAVKSDYADRPAQSCSR